MILWLATALAVPFTGVSIGGTWTGSKAYGLTSGVRVGLVYGFGTGDRTRTLTLGGRMLIQDRKAKVAFVEVGFGLAHAPQAIPAALDLIVGASFEGEDARPLFGATFWTAPLAFVTPRFDVDFRVPWGQGPLAGVGAGVGVFIPRAPQ